MVAGTLQTVGLAVGGLLAVLLVIGAGLYVADYGVEATIVDKNCPKVTAETHVGGVEVTRQVGGAKCSLVQRGDVVVYHIRSGDLVYKPQGPGAVAPAVSST